MGFDTLGSRPPGPSRACRRFAVAVIAATAFFAAQAQELQIIELQYRLADEVIPILQPLLEPGGVLTGTDDMLFVRTSPANFAQIQQALAVIDRKPRQLAISVGQGTVSTEGRSAASGSVVVGDGDVRVGVNATACHICSMGVEAVLSTIAWSPVPSNTWIAPVRSPDVGCCMTWSARS